MRALSGGLGEEAEGRATNCTNGTSAWPTVRRDRVIRGWPRRVRSGQPGGEDAAGDDEARGCAVEEGDPQLGTRGGEVREADADVGDRCPVRAPGEGAQVDGGVRDEGMRVAPVGADEPELGAGRGGAVAEAGAAKGDPGTVGRPAGHGVGGRAGRADHVDAARADVDAHELPLVLVVVKAELCQHYLLTPRVPRPNATQGVKELTLSARRVIDLHCLRGEVIEGQAGACGGPLGAAPEGWRVVVERLRRAARYVEEGDMWDDGPAADADRRGGQGLALVGDRFPVRRPGGGGARGVGAAQQEAGPRPGSRAVDLPQVRASVVAHDAVGDRLPLGVDGYVPHVSPGGGELLG
ncbi:MAG: hypothetical protein PVH17_09370, partial [Anaerolineae bacterium]